MTTEPNVKTIPVEVAIQREIEFQAKLRKLKLRSMIDSGPGFFLSPAPSSISLTQVSGERIATLPSGQKQKEPINPESSSSSLAVIAFPETNPTESCGLFCEICNVTCLTDFNYKQHVEGKKHKAMLLENSRSGEWCKVSNVWFMPGGSYQQHLGGQSHKAKLKSTREPKFCELCNVWCTDAALFQCHLRGKAHISKLAVSSRSTC